MKHLTEEQAQRQIEELQAHIESVRAAKKKEHFPQRNGTYFVPDCDYQRNHTIMNNIDYHYIFTNSAHRDRASADKHMEIIRYMVDLAREEEPLDWGDRGQSKFRLYWDHNADATMIIYDFTWHTQGAFYLPSDAACQKVIDKFGDDLRVLFGMSLKEG